MADLITSSSLKSLPIFITSIILPENKKGCCCTKAIFDLISIELIDLMFLSSIYMSPILGLMNFNIKDIIVLFPAPDDPTNAITCPFEIFKVISFKTSLSFLYSKLT